MDDIENMSIARVAKLSGVTVRTLHYYDDIGILKPCKLTQSGYRVYDSDSLRRLQQILLWREMGFSLKDIAGILDGDGYLSMNALKEQKLVLESKRNRIDSMIALVEQIMRGESDMSFREFDMSDIEKAMEKYSEETKKRYGNTKEYKQSQERTKRYTRNDWATIQGEADKIFDKFASAMETDVSDGDIRAMVLEWQAHITKYYYDCSDEILSGLAEMYVQDERFKDNIDKRKEGLAKFISESIKAYCAK